MRSPLTKILWLALLASSASPAGAWAERMRGPATPLIMAQVSDDDTPAASDQGGLAALTVRIDRMEGTIRSLTGQVEELQFQNRKLSEDLRKAQQDVEFRFQDLGRSGGGGAPLRPTAAPKRSDAEPPAGAGGLPQDASGTDPSTPNAPALPQRPARRVGDAFDPDANPNAPGAPRPLGTTMPSPAPATRTASTAGVTLNNAPSAPLDLMKRPGIPQAAAGDASTDNGVAPVVPGVAASTDPTAPRPAVNPNAVASLAPGGTRDEFNSDLDLYKQGQYDGAATGLKSFIDKYPRDRMVPDAVYLLGETYTKLGRHREAAEQYLRLSTDFSKAPRAPDALLRLGTSLNAMGVREQACATYQEVTRRYPAASTDVRTAVDREMKRARC